GWQVASSAMPSLPGATWTSWPSTRQRHASACSRPPPPTIRIFRVLPTCTLVPVLSYLSLGRAWAAPSVTEVALAGEHHRQAVLVGGGDDLVVADRAAGLDDRGDAGRGGR